MDIGANLDRLLQAKGWTLELLAVELQQRGTPINIHTLMSWRINRRTPNGRNLIALADALDCTTDEILRGPALEKAAS